LLLAGAAIGQGATKPSPIKPGQKHMVRFSFKQDARRLTVFEIATRQQIKPAATPKAKPGK
jgi:hypothetical protein